MFGGPERPGWPAAGPGTCGGGGFVAGLELALTTPEEIRAEEPPQPWSGTAAQASNISAVARRTFVGGRGQPAFSYAISGQTVALASRPSIMEAAESIYTLHPVLEESDGLSAKRALFRVQGTSDGVHGRAHLP